MFCSWYDIGLQQRHPSCLSRVLLFPIPYALRLRLLVISFLKYLILTTLLWRPVPVLFPCRLYILPFFSSFFPVSLLFSVPRPFIPSLVDSLSPWRCLASENTNIDYVTDTVYLINVLFWNPYFLVITLAYFQSNTKVGSLNNVKFHLKFADSNVSDYYQATLCKELYS